MYSAVRITLCIISPCKLDFVFHYHRPTVELQGGWLKTAYHHVSWSIYSPGYLIIDLTCLSLSVCLYHNISRSTYSPGYLIIDLTCLSLSVCLYHHVSLSTYSPGNLIINLTCLSVFLYHISWSTYSPGNLIIDLTCLSVCLSVCLIMFFGPHTVQVI